MLTRNYSGNKLTTVSVYPRLLERKSAKYNYNKRKVRFKSILIQYESKLCLLACLLACLFNFLLAFCLIAMPFLLACLLNYLKNITKNRLINPSRFFNYPERKKSSRQISFFIRINSKKIVEIDCK